MSKAVAPVGATLIIGYLISRYQQLPSGLNPDPIIAPCKLRGLAVVLLGVFCYTLSEKIKSSDLRKAKTVALVAIENLCWLISLWFVISNADSRYEGIIVYVIALAVTLTFSRDFECKLYNNPLVMYLGKIR